jgi:FkbM family methyltransferase
MLDKYQSQYRLYDWVLGEIAKLIASKYPGATMIDIGANVGDTAALLCRHCDIPILCIEGNPRFLEYLRRNAQRLPASIEIVECLIGASPGSVSARDLKTAAGTASLVDTDPTPRGGQQILVRPLADILREHTRFQRPKLIKTDTDGSDFEILNSSMNAIRDLKPILFFEYDPTSRKDGMPLANRTIAELGAAGYQHFLVYDNFGHFMRLIDKNQASEFMDLNRYLMSHLLFGRQIYYVDVLAIGEDDQSLVPDLMKFHHAMIEHYVTRAGRQS